MSNLKNARLKSKLDAALHGVARTSFVTLLSMAIPTILSSLIFFAMFEVPVWFDGDVYAASDSLFSFYVWCSVSYLFAMLIAILGATFVEEINLTTKTICIIMFIMVVDNLVMAMDALDFMTWSALEEFDSWLQIACGVAFLTIGVLCLITKLWRYVFRSLGYPYGY